MRSQWWLHTDMRCQWWQDSVIFVYSILNGLYLTDCRDKWGFPAVDGKITLKLSTQSIREVRYLLRKIWPSIPPVLVLQISSLHFFYFLCFLSCQVYISEVLYYLFLLRYRYICMWLVFFLQYMLYFIVFIRLCDYTFII